MSQRYCSLRTRPQKFGISFVVPDHLASEISDKKKIRGKNPMRIVRFPSEGQAEFRKWVEEASKDSKPQPSQCSVTIRGDDDDDDDYGDDIPIQKPNPKRAYRRSCVNDWNVHVLYIGKKKYVTDEA